MEIVCGEPQLHLFQLGLIVKLAQLAFPRLYHLREEVEEEGGRGGGRGEERWRRGRGGGGGGEVCCV